LGFSTPQAVDECQFDTVYHEHYSYHSLTGISNVFRTNGLSVFDVEQLPTHGGSLRVYAQRTDTGTRPVTEAVTALLAGEEAGLSRTGLADPRIRFNVNFLGAPALDAGEFAHYRQKTIAGATLEVTAPLGEYDETKRVNLGANRWTLRPEVVPGPPKPSLRVTMMSALPGDRMLLEPVMSMPKFMPGSGVTEMSGSLLTAVTKAVSPGSAANIAIENEELDRSVTKYKHAVSPRLGFAFPITDRDAFHFHYGRFVQFPQRQFLFASQSTVGCACICSARSIARASMLLSVA